jgi:hypothetical protein
VLRDFEVADLLRPDVDFEAPLRAFELELEPDLVLDDFFEADLRAVDAPPLRPPFFIGSLFSFLPRPDPLFFPPPLLLFTVAQARRSASFSETPRFS